VGSKGPEPSSNMMNTTSFPFVCKGRKGKKIRKMVIIKRKCFHFGKSNGVEKICEKKNIGA
jgi:hypothetical protein